MIGDNDDDDSDSSDDDYMMELGGGLLDTIAEETDGGVGANIIRIDDHHEGLGRRESDDSGISTDSDKGRSKKKLFFFDSRNLSFSQTYLLTY